MLCLSSWYRCSRHLSIRVTPSRLLSSSSTPPSWEKWEFGTFEHKHPFQHQHVPSPLNEELKEDQENGLNSRRIFPETFWSYFNEEEVARSIDILRPLCTQHRLDRFDYVLNHRTNRVRFLFENPSNPNNVWACLRTMDTFGIQNVDVITGSEVPGNTATISPFKAAQTLRKKATMTTALGTQKWLTLEEHSSVEACIRKLKAQGYRVYATIVNETAKPIGEVDWTGSAFAASEGSLGPSSPSSRGKSVIIMGNEETGTSPAALALADECFYIPMLGFAESLNLAAASAVIAATLHAKGALVPDVDPKQRQTLMLTWLARSVPSSVALLHRNGLPVHGKKLYPSIGNYTTKP